MQRLELQRDGLRGGKQDDDYDEEDCAGGEGDEDDDEEEDDELERGESVGSGGDWAICIQETEAEQALRERRRVKLNEVSPLRKFAWCHKRRFGATSFFRPGWTQSEVMVTVIGLGGFPSQIEYLGAELSVSAPTNFVIDEKECVDSFPGQEILPCAPHERDQSKIKHRRWFTDVLFPRIRDRRSYGQWRSYLCVEIIAYSGSSKSESKFSSRISKRTSASRSIKLMPGGRQASDDVDDSSGQGKCIGRVYCTLQSILDKAKGTDGKRDRSMMTSSWMTASVRMMPLAWTDSLFTIARVASPWALPCKRV